MWSPLLLKRVQADSAPTSRALQAYSAGARKNEASDRIQYPGVDHKQMPPPCLGSGRPVVAK